MFSVFGSDRTRTCAGLSLPGLLASKAQAAGNAGASRGKSVVTLFLVGGPPQVETFDPKEGVPDDIRSCTGEVQTALPGVKFGGTFPKMGAMADRLAVVRSFASGDGGHNQMPVLTGRNTLKAPMGTLVSRALGTMDHKTGVPTSAVLIPESVQPDLKPGNPTGRFELDYVNKNYVPARNLGLRTNPALPPADVANFVNNGQPISELF